MNVQKIEEEISKMSNDAERAGTPMTKERLEMMKHSMQIDGLMQYLFDIHELSGIAFRNFHHEDSESFDIHDVQTCLRIIKQQVEDALVMFNSAVEYTKRQELQNQTK